MISKTKSLLVLYYWGCASLSLHAWIWTLLCNQFWNVFYVCHCGQYIHHSSVFCAHKIIIKILVLMYKLQPFYSTDRLLSGSMYPSSLVHTSLLIEKIFVELECVCMAIE